MIRARAESAVVPVVVSALIVFECYVIANEASNGELARQLCRVWDRLAGPMLARRRMAAVYERDRHYVVWEAIETVEGAGGV